jgi:methylated-DNA-[protein]-cysteine S-methyltransferase
MTYNIALFDTPIGPCGIAWGARGVIGVQLPEKSVSATRTRLLRHCPAADETAPTAPIKRAIEDITALMSGEKRTLRAIVLDMMGIAEFNARVYEAARAIPPGQTRTYGDIARSIGAASAARAVGKALGRNPFAIIVPCHRVVGANGTMVGFSANGGVGMKARMLEIEGVRAAPSLFDALN